MNVRLHGPYWLLLIAAGFVALKVHDAGVRRAVVERQRADSISAAYQHERAVQVARDVEQARQVDALKSKLAEKTAAIVDTKVDLDSAKTVADTVALLRQQVQSDSVTKLQLSDALTAARNVITEQDARIASLTAANQKLDQDLATQIAKTVALEKDANPGFLRWTFKSPARVVTLLAAGYIAGKAGL